MKVPLHIPYDWNQVLGYLKRHETYGTEIIHENTYSRFIFYKKNVGVVRVSKLVKDEFLTINFSNIPVAEMRSILLKIKNVFDTDHNPIHLPHEIELQPKGIRVPGCFDPFETVVSIILSQLVSTQQAKAKLKALVCAFGRPFGKFDGTACYEFPQPSVLAEAEIEKIGLTKVKAHAIREFSKAFKNGELNFEIPQV